MNLIAIMNDSGSIWLAPLSKLLNDVREPKPGKEGLEKLMSALTEVDALLSRNRSQMPPELVHFLERRSYEKAAQFCEGNLGVARGTCGARN